MGRPRKADDEKLVPVTVYIRPSRYERLRLRAKADDKKLSEWLRDKIDPRVPLQENKPPA
jgi:hypothetical protein